MKHSSSSCSILPRLFRHSEQPDSLLRGPGLDFYRQRGAAARRSHPHRGASQCHRVHEALRRSRGRAGAGQRRWVFRSLLRCRDGSIHCFGSNGTKVSSVGQPDTRFENRAGDLRWLQIYCKDVAPAIFVVLACGRQLAELKIGCLFSNPVRRVNLELEAISKRMAILTEYF